MSLDWDSIKPPKISVTGKIGAGTGITASKQDKEKKEFDWGSIEKPIYQYKSKSTPGQINQLFKQQKSEQQMDKLDLERLKNAQGTQKPSEIDLLKLKSSYPEPNPYLKYFSVAKTKPAQQTTEQPKSSVLSNLWTGAKVLGKSLLQIPKNVKASYLQMTQGAEGASVVNQDKSDQYIQKVNKENVKLVQEAIEKYGDIQVLPGLKLSDIASVSQNIGYTGVSMGAGLAAGVPTSLIPVPGSRVLAYALGTAASGKAAYEMSTYEIMQTYLEAKNEEIKESTGKGLTAEEEVKLKAEFDSLASKYGLWEALPEAISNLSFVGLLTTPLTKMVGKNIATKIVSKLSGIYGEELLTETITQMGQQGILKQVDLPGGKEINWTSVKDWKQAFKEIAPQTFLLTTLMTGAGQVAINSTKIVDSLKNEIGENNPNFNKIKEKIENKEEIKEAFTQKEETKPTTEKPAEIQEEMPDWVTEKQGGEEETSSFTKIKQETSQAIEKMVQDKFEELKTVRDMKMPSDKGIIKDSEGRTIDRYNISNRPLWYQELRRELGRKPNNTELKEEAKRQLREQDPDFIKLEYQLEAWEMGEEEQKKQGISTGLQNLQGTGEERTRGMSLSTEARAVEKGLTNELGDLPQYKQLDFAQQAKKATDLVNQDFERATRIAMGEEQPSPAEGLLKNAVYKAVENRAISDGNYLLLKQLGTTSARAEEATSMGREIGYLGYTQDDMSAVKAIKDLTRLREQNITEKVKPKIEKEITKAKDFVNKEAQNYSNWEDFVNAIRC